MTLEKVANLHRAPSVRADCHFKLRLFVLPIGTTLRRDRIVIGVTHHARESRCTVTGEHDVIGFSHHLPRDENRIFYAL